MNTNIGKLAITNAELWKLAHIAFGVLVILTVAIVLRRTASRYIASSVERYRVRKAIALVAWLAGFLLVIAAFSDRLGTFGITLGVVGAGVALSLQDVIASVAGWASISTGNVYKTGDRIQIAGVRGDVIDIGVFRTTLMEIGQWVNGDLYNGRIVRIANNAVFKDVVYNYSADFPFVWDELTLPVKYGGDYKLAGEILNRVASQLLGEYVASAKATWKAVAQKYLIEQAQIEPMVTLLATDNWIEFTLRYIVDYKLRRITRHQLFVRILDELERTNGRVEIASGTYAIVEAPPLELNIKEPKARSEPL
jgi:small-conductance mechanosensitive channel